MNSNQGRISKLNAASRLHDSALELWFKEGELLAIHVIAASAHQIIHDINKATGGEDLLYDSLNIKDEFRTEYVRMIKQPWNFLKHADHDPGAELEFEPNGVLRYFIFNLKGLKQLGQTFSSVSMLFLFWLGLHHPTWLRSIDRFRETWGTTLANEAELRLLSRSDFYHEASRVVPSLAK